MFLIKLPKLTGGPAVIVFSFGVQNLLRLASNLVLTRLLFPEAFGLMAIVGSVLFLLELSSDMGFKAFLIRHEHGDEPRYLDTIWSIRLIRGVFLGLCLVALAYPISRFYESTELFPILVFTAITFFVRGLESISLILAEREQKLVRLAMIELSAFIARVIVTITLAYFFKNVWSLAIGGFFGATLLVALSYLFFENSIRAFRIDRAVFLESWAFAKVIIGSSILTIIITQFDTIFIGKFFGLQLLGVYAIAFSLAQAFVQLARTVIIRVIYPRLSRVCRSDRSNLKSAFYGEKAKFVPYFLVVCGFFTAVGDTIIDILFDQRYQQAGIFFSILMAKPILLAMTLPAEQCLIASGKIAVALTSSVLRTLWLATGVVLGYSVYGVYGLVLAVATIDMLPLVYLLRELGKLEIVDFRLEAMNLLLVLAALAVGWIFNYLVMKSDFISILIAT